MIKPWYLTTSRPHILKPNPMKTFLTFVLFLFPDEYPVCFKFFRQFLDATFVDGIFRTQDLNLLVALQFLLSKCEDLAPQVVDDLALFLVEPVHLVDPLHEVVEVGGIRLGFRLVSLGLRFLEFRAEIRNAAAYGEQSASECTDD